MKGFHYDPIILMTNMTCLMIKPSNYCSAHAFQSRSGTERL